MPFADIKIEDWFETSLEVCTFHCPLYELRVLFRNYIDISVKIPKA